MLVNGGMLATLMNSALQGPRPHWPFAHTLTMEEGLSWALNKVVGSKEQVFKLNICGDGSCTFGEHGLQFSLGRGVRLPS